MGKWNICVYAICKNERQFVERWMASMKEADSVVVLDTGSTDGTEEALREAGARVETAKIAPWRFDTARNRSLTLVPEEADICVCTDLDEVFHPGWRAALETAWQPETCLANYRYTWSFTPSGKEGVVFYIAKIHRRGCFHWTGPVHEVLQYEGQGQCPAVTAAGVQLDHYPDPAKSRGQYLPLLELAVAEDPENDRNTHYLGREYLFYRRWDDCIRTLEHHLKMPSAVWADERCASMRYLARAYLQQGQQETALCWLHRAIAEAPHLREPYVDAALLCYERGEDEGVLYYTGRALAVLERPATYICEAEAWGSLPYDLRSVALYRQGHYKQALAAVQQALSFEPDNERLKNNAALIKKETDNWEEIQ